MCTNKTDIHNSSYKDDYSYYAIIISCNIENITAIFHIVSRRKHLFQVCMAFPLRSPHSFNPFIQGTSCTGMRLHKVI